MVKSKFYNLDTDETLASNSDYYIPSQKATKAYVDNISSTQTNTISNCILEIPQNIKLTLENNVLTLKAGSILTMTGSTYATSTTTVDRTYTISSSLIDGFYLIFADIASIHSPRILSKVSSGNSSGFPTENLDQYNIYFNTDDQLIYRYNTTTSTWQNFVSYYPICLIEIKSGIASFAKDDNGYDIIFNTMCFMGKYAIAYPEIKGLIADGLNEDGTLKSKLYINGALQIIDSANVSGYIISQNPLSVNLARTSSIKEVETLDDIDLSTSLIRYYIKSLNKYYVHFNANLTTYEHLTIASFKADSNGIYNITVRQPVRLATTEITDKINADLSNVVHKTGNEEVAGNKTLTGTTTFQQGSITQKYIATNYTAQTAPTGDTYLTHRYYLDSNSRAVMDEYYYIPRNTNRPTYILRFRDCNGSSSNVYKDIINCGWDGTNGYYNISDSAGITTRAPTPTENTTASKQIDTVGARNTALQGYATTSLDNLSFDGQKIVDSQNGTISNCILEIPQNINLTLENNVLTLKAGSILTKTGNTYTTATVGADKTLDFTAEVAVASDGYYPLVVGFSTAPNKQGLIFLSKWNSGSELPATGNNNDVYYNVTDKLIYLYGNGSWVQWGVAYPLALLQVINHQLSFAKDSNGNDMIFNGACFIGHHSVIYPFSKYLLCNGINSNGTMNSYKCSLDSLQIIELVTNRDVITLDNNLHLSAWKKVDKDKNSLTSGEMTYVASENLTYGNNGSSIAAFRRCFFVDFIYNGTTVTDFTICQPVRLANAVSVVVAGSTADKIDVTKNGFTSTITINNVANATNATKATQDASGNVITTTYATKSELPKTTIRVWS